jgi:Protein of unknown function (DUF3150)
MKNLSEKALLVNLKISQWSGRKYDRAISKKIEKDHNARNAGRYNKNLLGEGELNEIQKISSSARSYLYDNTLPWGDNGDRLLPATNYFQFITDFKDYKAQFDSAVVNFVVHYPELKEDAKRRLNGMFVENDYPSPTMIKDKFNVTISFMPISETDDFRLKVDVDEVNKLKDQIAQEINSRITQATKSIWTRIKETVGHMVEKLSDKDAKFHNTLVTNIQELIEVLPRLNFTGNNDINDTIESMKTLLIDPDHLRTSFTLRNRKASEAKEILDKVQDFLG